MLTFFSRLSVKTRLMLGFGFVLLTMATLVAVGIVRVNMISHNLQEIAERHSVKQRHAINFRGSVHDRAIALRDLALIQSTTGFNTTIALIDRLENDYRNNEQALTRLLADTNASPQELAAYREIAAVQARAEPMRAQVIQLVQAGQGTPLNRYLIEDVGPTYEAWLAAINRFIDLQEQAGQRSARQAEAVAASFQTEMLVLCLIALLAGIALSALITRSLTTALGGEPDDVRAFAQRVGQGDLRVPEVSRRAPPQSIVAALAGMADQLADVVAHGRQTAGIVQQATQQLVSRNDDLLARTESQASAVTQTASAMEQLGSTVNQNADNARQADELAATALNVAQRGGDTMRTVIETMRNLNERSREIADIIGMIDSIAFQTNILALNAAVEAARASQHGRGFAVVASEVRTLAQRSAGAARDIKSLITQNLQWVETGTQQVDKAGEATEEVIAAIQRVSAIMTEISNASREQSAGVQQVGHAVVEMDRNTDHNRAFVAESTTFARHLQAQAEALTHTLAAFDLSSGPAPEPSAWDDDDAGTALPANGYLQLSRAG